METKENIGQIIAKARKKKGITQQELAKLLYVSNKAISNWETGKNYPDISALQNISKYLDIDLLSSLTKKEHNNKFKKTTFFLIKIVVTILCLLLVLFFINNFNKTKYYTISLNSKEYSIENSNLVIGNNRIILNLGTINKGDNFYNFDIFLYYLDNGNRKQIITEYDYNNLNINCNYKKNIYFETKMFDDLTNFYLSISYYDDATKKNVSDDINLIFKQEIATNKLLYLTNDSILDINSRTITLLENVGYKKSDDNTYIRVYEKDNKSIALTYDLNNLVFDYIVTDDKMIKHAIYNIENKTLEYNITYENVLVENFIYKDALVCILGTCDNYQELIDEFFNEYNLIK